jgi:hypothetical protein
MKQRWSTIEVCNSEKGPAYVIALWTWKRIEGFLCNRWRLLVVMKQKHVHSEEALSIAFSARADRPCPPVCGGRGSAGHLV